MRTTPSWLTTSSMQASRKTAPAGLLSTSCDITTNSGAGTAASAVQSADTNSVHCWGSAHSPTVSPKPNL